MVPLAGLGEAPLLSVFVNVCPLSDTAPPVQGLGVPPSDRITTPSVLSKTNSGGPEIFQLTCLSEFPLAMLTMNAGLSWIAQPFGSLTTVTTMSQEFWPAAISQGTGVIDGTVASAPVAIAAHAAARQAAGIRKDTS